MRPIRSGRPQRATGLTRLHLRSRLTLCRKLPRFAVERFTMNLLNSYVP